LLEKKKAGGGRRKKAGSKAQPLVGTRRKKETKKKKTTLAKVQPWGVLPGLRCTYDAKKFIMPLEVGDPHTTWGGSGPKGSPLLPVKKGLRGGG